MSSNPSRNFMLAAVAALALQGCEDALRPLAPRPRMAVATEVLPLVPRTIAPQETDPNIDWVPPGNPNCTDPECNDHHVWLDASRSSNAKLFVFLPGIASQAPRPRAHQLMPQEAARLGYHVIGLMYQNTVGPGGCVGSPDPECFEKVRQEIIDGVDRSQLVNVTGVNSIENRLTKLLLYLDAKFPDEGWSKFLHMGEPKWSEIAVGGHSGGAAQAALIAKTRHVDRVVMLSGPASESAPWVAIGETPAAKYFALDHVRDHFGSVILANIRALDMERFGAAVQTELSEPPYDGTHILVTDLEPRGGYATPNPHNSTAVDRWAALGPDGSPLLRDAWRYMLGEHETADADVTSDALAVLRSTRRP